MIRRPPRSTLSSSSAASDVYKRQQVGAPSASDLAGISATISPLSLTLNLPSLVTLPMTAESKPHLSKIFLISFSFPFLTTTIILSWDSESIISKGFIPSSRVGTLDNSLSNPLSPRLAISHKELVKPAAPQSCNPTTYSYPLNSKQASINNFSEKGS